MIVALPYHLPVGVVIATRVTRSWCLQAWQQGSLSQGGVTRNSGTSPPHYLTGHPCACVIASCNHEAIAVWHLNTTSKPAKIFE